MKIKKEINRRRSLMMLIYVLVFGVLFASSSDIANAAGLVPCGGPNDEAKVCTLCHLIIGIGNIITWGRNILVAVALSALTVAGIMYMISAGNDKMMEAAKTYMKQSLIGFTVVLAAWLIVNSIMYYSSASGNNLGISATAWNEFTCSTEYTLPSSSEYKGADDSTETGTNLTTYSGSSNYDPEKEAEVRKRLADAGVKINRENACTSSTETECTSVAGLKEETIQGIIDLKESCDAASKEPCDVIVNSGSEEGSHGESLGTGRSHGEGRKVDYEATTSLSSYIENNSTIQDSSDFNKYTDEHTYVDKQGTHYVVENGSVWDSCYNCTY